MSVTLQRVAHEVGVSIPVVSLVLNGKGQHFSAGTQQRVREAALRLGYRPNVFARAVATGRTGCASLVISTVGEFSALPAGLLHGIEGELARHDMHLTIARLPDEKLTSEGYVPKILREYMSDGLLINYTHHIPNKMIELIEAYSVPVTWINCKLPRDSVHPDDYGAGRLAAEKFLALGHRRAAFVPPYDPTGLAAGHYSVQDRKAGFAAALRRARMRPAEPPPATGTYAQRFAALGDYLADSQARPTALFCYEPGTAANIVAAAARLGIRVPQDLSIIVCSDGPSEALGLRFDTLVVPNAHVGILAVRTMLAKAKRRSFKPLRQAVPLTFSPGESCAQAPGS